MSTVKSLRLSPELLRSVKARARRERLDESTAMRQLMAIGAETYAVRLYRDGEATLNEAALIANTTPREMLEILLAHGVRGNVTLEQQRKAMSNLLAAEERLNRSARSRS